MSKITHEEVNITIQYEQANQDIFTEKQMKLFYEYFEQQEKKDELLKLYREKDRLELFLRYKKDIDIVDRNYCCNELSKIRNQIKILNEV